MFSLFCHPFILTFFASEIGSRLRVIECISVVVHCKCMHTFLFHQIFLLLFSKNFCYTALISDYQYISTNKIFQKNFAAGRILLLCAQFGVYHPIGKGAISRPKIASNQPAVDAPPSCANARKMRQGKVPNLQRKSHDSKN